MHNPVTEQSLLISLAVLIFTLSSATCLFAWIKMITRHASWSGDVESVDSVAWLGDDSDTEHWSGKARTSRLETFSNRLPEH